MHLPPLPVRLRRLPLFLGLSLLLLLLHPRLWRHRPRPRTVLGCRLQSLRYRLLFRRFLLRQ